MISGLVARNHMPGLVRDRPCKSSAVGSTRTKSNRQKNPRLSCRKQVIHSQAQVTQEGDGLLEKIQRRSALSMAAVLALVSPSPSRAAVPKGFNPVKNVNKGYAFLYPFGWQEVNVDGAEVAYKDIIEPLESLSLEILPTNKASIEEFGKVDVLADTLVKQVLVPPSQEATVLEKAEREQEGTKYYTIEYTAKAKNFTRHSLTTLAVSKGKLYTVTTGANEKRWPIMKEKLKLVAQSFTLL